MSHVAQHRTEDKQSDEKGTSIEDEKQTSAGVHTVEALPAGSVDPIYAAKAQALNDAIQSIGMGRYQVISFPVFLQSKIPLWGSFGIYHIILSFYFMLVSLQAFHSGTCS